MATIDQIAAKLQRAIASQQSTITVRVNELTVERNGTVVSIPQIPQRIVSRNGGFR